MRGITFPGNSGAALVALAILGAVPEALAFDCFVIDCVRLSVRGGNVMLNVQPGEPYVNRLKPTLLNSASKGWGETGFLWQTQPGTKGWLPLGV